MMEKRDSDNQKHNLACAGGTYRYLRRVEAGIEKCRKKPAFEHAIPVCEDTRELTAAHFREQVVNPTEGRTELTARILDSLRAFQSTLSEIREKTRNEKQRAALTDFLKNENWRIRIVEQLHSSCGVEPVIHDLRKGIEVDDSLKSMLEEDSKAGFPLKLQDKQVKYHWRALRNRLVQRSAHT